MNKILKVMKLALLCSTLAMPAQAQGVPTVDVTAIAKFVEMISTARQQLQEQVLANLKLDDQILKMVEQIRLLQAQYAALTESWDALQLLFDPDTFLAEITPDFADLSGALDAAQSGDWQSVLSSGGTVGGGSVSAYVDRQFNSAGLTRSQVDDLSASESSTAARIGNAANVNAFMSVAAQSSSEAASESLGRLDTLVGKIPDTENLKQSIDLNTRVTAELGIALANIWAMEAVQTVGMGQAGIMDAATAADEEKYLKIQLEE